MKLTANSIALKYENAIIVPTTINRQTDVRLVATVCANMLELGFVPSNGLYETFHATPKERLVQIHDELITNLKQMVGADVSYQPLYPNFPEQVIDATDAELFLNAIVHYLTFGQWKPYYHQLPREVAFERTTYKTIDVITENSFDSIFARLVGSNDSLSESDKETIKWFINSGRDLRLPSSIPFKENLCYIAGVFLENGKDVTPLINTATDAMRIAAYLSGGDISLAEPTKYKSLPRPVRRQLVHALASVATEEDIARHRNKWIKLFHNLHVGDYSNKVYNLAKKVRNNESIQTFNGKVQEALDTGDVQQAVYLLTERPGEFARRLDHVLRLACKQKNDTWLWVVEQFGSCVDQIPTRIRLQLLGHFNQRAGDSEHRVAFPKGSVQKAVLLEGQKALPPIVVQTIQRVLIDSLQTEFAQLESLGNVWIDPRLDQCPLPTQMRSASNGLFQVARGTRLPFGDDKNTLRFFIYWVGRDIDLSATFHDQDFNTVGNVAYFNLRSSELGTYHSGDIVSAPDGASEFIDVTIDKAIKYGARYVAMNVIVFSGPSFAEHEKVYAGWMTRNKPGSNEVYDPTTVEQKIDLTSESRNSVPVVFDLVERKAIWTDLNTRGIHNDPVTPPGFVGRFGSNNVRVNRASIQQTVQSIVDMSNKVTLHELFTMHGNARGQLVDEREQADVTFGFDQTVDITPYNIDVINSQFIT